jgi:hypothetical protein
MAEHLAIKIATSGDGLGWVGELAQLSFVGA